MEVFVLVVTIFTATSGPVVSVAGPYVSEPACLMDLALAQSDEYRVGTSESLGVPPESLTLMQACTTLTPTFEQYMRDEIWREST